MLLFMKRKLTERTFKSWAYCAMSRSASRASSHRLPSIYHFRLSDHTLRGNFLTDPESSITNKTSKSLLKISEGWITFRKDLPQIALHNNRPRLIHHWIIPFDSFDGRRRFHGPGYLHSGGRRVFYALFDCGNATSEPAKGHHSTDTRM